MQLDLIPLYHMYLLRTIGMHCVYHTRTGKQQIHSMKDWWWSILLVMVVLAVVCIMIAVGAVVMTSKHGGKQQPSPSSEDHKELLCKVYAEE